MDVVIEERDEFETRASKAGVPRACRELVLSSTGANVAFALPRERDPGSEGELRLLWTREAGPESPLLLGVPWIPVPSHLPRGAVPRAIVVVARMDDSGGTIRLAESAREALDRLERTVLPSLRSRNVRRDARSAAGDFRKFCRSYLGRLAPAIAGATAGAFAPRKQARRKLRVSVICFARDTMYRVARAGAVTPVPRKPVRRPGRKTARRATLPYVDHWWSGGE